MEFYLPNTVSALLRLVEATTVACPDYCNSLLWQLREHDLQSQGPWLLLWNLSRCLCQGYTVHGLLLASDRTRQEC